jgi:hypothetical protein
VQASIKAWFPDSSSVARLNLSRSTLSVSSNISSEMKLEAPVEREFRRISGFPP